MKEIFIASSSEALDQAERIAAVLEEVPNVKPRLWKAEFVNGDITFIRIEELAREISGAVVVATPDDVSEIRGQRGRTARANVLFEYGFLVASLGRHRVALCRYEDVVLPSDFNGLTHISMGKWTGPRVLEASKTICIKDWANRLEQRGHKEEIEFYEQRLRELRNTYRDVLDGKVEHTRRTISFQLDILEEKLREPRSSGRFSEICILGINATGPLHQGREMLIQLLSKRGKLRLLLLDPKDPIFQRRREHENDHVGRITAELQASFYILMDILSQVRLERDSDVPDVEIRLHNQFPDRSLLMIDCDEEEGIVLENPYPDLKGKRGLEGQMYPLVQRGRTTRGYRENVRYYKELWKIAKPVVINNLEDLRVEDWPFSPVPVGQ